MTTKGCLRPAELAQMAALSTDTLRHYERKGLLKATRSPNGYREYPPDAPARLNLVQHALSVGFSLDELAAFLGVRDRGGAPCHDVRALAAKKLQEVESRIRGLNELRNELRALLADWDARLAKTKGSGKALLLESLAGAPVAQKRHSELRGKGRP